MRGIQLKRDWTKDITENELKKLHPKLEDYFEFFSGSISSRLSGSQASPTSNMHVLNTVNNPSNMLNANQKDVADNNIKTDADFHNGSRLDEQTQSDTNEMDRLEFDPTIFDQKIAIKPNTFNALIIPKKKGLLERLSLQSVLEFKPNPKPFIFK